MPDENNCIELTKIQMTKEQDIFIPEKLMPYSTINALEHYISCSLGFMILFNNPGTPCVKAKLKFEIETDKTQIKAMRVS